MADQLPEDTAPALDEFATLIEAKEIALEIARRESLSEDAVFADAMHVTVALALEAEDLPYTRANAAWMFGRISPSEVRIVLLLRRDHPNDYLGLPKAHTIDSLCKGKAAAALEAVRALTGEELNKLFFSDDMGHA